MFAGVPLSQHSLLWGQTWWKTTHGEPLLAMLLMILVTTQEPSSWGSKLGDWNDSHAGLPLNLDWI